MNESNFAYEVYRQSQQSQFIDATTGNVFCASDIVRAAGMLRATGLQQGDFLLISSGIDPESALVYLGSIYAGIVPIPVSDADGDRYLPSLIAATGARFLWTKVERSTEHAITRDLHVIRGFALPELELLQPASTKPSDVAVLMPTSGSTGTPKLVQVTHENLFANSSAIIKSQRLTKTDRTLLVLPISYCFGASVLHTHLLVGGDIVCERRMMFPDKVLDSIDRYRCTTLAGVPTVFRTLLRHSRFTTKPPVTLQKVFQAGGALDRTAIQQLRQVLPNVQLFVMYGQTEATARISTLDPSDLNDHLGTVGRPLDGVQIRVVNGVGIDCQANESGEIWVHGPSVTRGYWRDPESNQHKFRDGWLRTGDIGNIDESGFLTIAGRLDSFVKIKGLRLALGEVETIVRQLPEIEDVAACKTPHDQFGEAVALFIVLSSGYSEVQANASIRRALPPHWAIQQVRSVCQLPKTNNSKIDRLKLQTWAEHVVPELITDPPTSHEFSSIH